MLREPPEETVGLYPGLIVHDGRVSGSVTVGRSRLPLWAFVPQLIRDGWGADLDEAFPSAGELGADGLARFLTDLLQLRGEFARLLLVLADAERADAERQDVALAPHGPVVQISLSPGDGGVQLPARWWEDDDEVRAQVRAQLERCLAALDDT